MVSSATIEGREARRAATAQRISGCAQGLTLRHGLDGFTMDDLALEADVSRRTLFNYYPSKDDAVLGTGPEFDPELVAEFVAGGPYGHLIDDITVLVRTILEANTPERAEVTRVRRVLHEEPKLLDHAKARFDELTDQFRDQIRRREGNAYDEARARLLIHLVLAVFDLSMVAFVDHPGRELADLFGANMDVAQDLFAPSDPGGGAERPAPRATAVLP